MVINHPVHCHIGTSVTGPWTGGWQSLARGVLWSSVCRK